MIKKLKHYDFGPNDLGFFIDESGDTALRDPKNSMFVFGAALVLGSDIIDIHNKWGAVRKAITGSHDQPVHMRLHSSIIRDLAQDALINFFNSANIGRLAVSFVQEGNFDLKGKASSIVLQAVFDELLARQAELCSRVWFRSITIVFEKSPLIKEISKLSEGLALQEGPRKVPVNFIHLSKSAYDPNLEIADVISHTMSGSLRSKPAPEFIQERFQSIFQPKNEAAGLARELTGNFYKEKS